LDHDPSPELSQALISGKLQSANGLSEGGQQILELYRKITTEPRSTGLAERKKPKAAGIAPRVLVAGDNRPVRRPVRRHRSEGRATDNG
jgi:hypothetical protein